MVTTARRVGTRRRLYFEPLDAETNRKGQGAMADCVSYSAVNCATKGHREGHSEVTSCPMWRLVSVPYAPGRVDVVAPTLVRSTLGRQGWRAEGGQAAPVSARYLHLLPKDVA